MIESPIKRKHLFYPKDFLPNSSRQSTISKRFNLNQQYHIEASTIKKYDQSFQLDARDQKNSKYTQISINPQKLIINSMELGQQSPLDPHFNQKRPDINGQILKKPRFCIKKDDQIAQNDDFMQHSSSPGYIKKQYENRQIPLPLEDPCKIQLVKQQNNKTHSIPNSIIKFKASSFAPDKKWHSNERQLIQNFKQSRHKRSLNQFPEVKNQGLNKSLNFSGGKEIFDNFRKKQQYNGDNMGKINSLLSSLKNKDLESPKKIQLPKFQQTNVQRIKDEINQLIFSKKKMNNNNRSNENDYQNEQNQEDDNESQENYRNTNPNVIKNKKKASNHNHLQEYLVSYRSSLSFLKDLYMQTIHLKEYRLIVKIPKLFTENLIFKHQDKTQLYETAKSIFYQLKIPHQNLIIKRYTNCTMMISRNICLIWHFDGKRYLGGWQTEYLDEGCKHGLGLQWQPKSYVYYGQFLRNKKQGLGVYKDRGDNMLIGYWKKGKYINEKEECEHFSKHYSQNAQLLPNINLYSQEDESQNNRSNYQYL